LPSTGDLEPNNRARWVCIPEREHKPTE